MHVVGDDDDGDLLAEGLHELLDLVGGDGVEGGAGFVHQEDFGLGGDGAGDAEALLLAAGEGEGGGVQAVLDFVPQAGGFEGAFGGFFEDGAFADAVDAQRVDDVFEDGLGEGVGFLEDHADAFAEGDDVDAGGVDFAAVDVDGAVDAAGVDEVVHAVEAAEEGGFAAAGGADEGGDSFFGDVRGRFVEGVLFCRSRG